MNPGTRSRKPLSSLCRADNVDDVDRPEWQAATEALIMAAEDRGPVMHAYVGMLLALRGAKPIPEYDRSKDPHWGRRKLK